MSSWWQRLSWSDATLIVSITIVIVCWGGLEAKKRLDRFWLIFLTFAIAIIGFMVSAIYLVVSGAQK